MTRAMRMMAEFECWPLWDSCSGDNLNPAELGLSPALVVALAEWSDAYTRTLNQRDPPSSRFRSKADEQAWEAEGLRLLRRLRDELGPSVQVTYESPNAD